MRLCCRLLLVAGLLLGSFFTPVWAESDKIEPVRHSQVKPKNIAPAYSCYTDLTMMVRGSSFDVAAKLRPSLRLSVERDDGDQVLARLHRGGGDGGQIGWVIYRPATQSLRDVSQIVENEDREAAFVAENGKMLKIDRRFAYLFNQCRQRHDVAQAVSCRQRQQDSHIERTTLALWAQGQVARLDKGSVEKVTLYSAPDMVCPLSQEVVLKAGTALKIYHEADDFYFVRQDGFKRDFITGWILKEQVQNVKFVNAPASAQASHVTQVPALKPPMQQRLDEKPPSQLAEPVRLEPASPEFDLQQGEAVQLVVNEEERIPIPLAAKPLPSDMEPKPQRRRRPVFVNHDSGRDD